MIIIPGKRSKPGRPTKRIQKQLDAIDTQMEKLSDDIPGEEDDHADLTESEQPRCPYSLRSRRQNNEGIDDTQDNARDELS